MLRDNAGWLMCRVAAARTKLPCSASAITWCFYRAVVIRVDQVFAGPWFHGRGLLRMLWSGQRSGVELGDSCGYHGVSRRSSRRGSCWRAWARRRPLTQRRLRRLVPPELPDILT